MGETQHPPTHHSPFLGLSGATWGSIKPDCDNSLIHITVTVDTDAQTHYNQDIFLQVFTTKG